ncbi:MAG: biotin--[acetyl-CoA-carboxylase] ligase [Rhodospirillales bacterium]|jgi:BirA family biotin operon repressor/biotin-[acetyl-CoA-carboxylase] ligase|nr:biotin--[acetyl-CoA-carboxylase] ligase [Rhodospirillales bacterium]MDP6883082.1 biotin--[acetyl-CoA-carboxylase] ligase [Rhodospirillales bacterium]
MTQAPRLPGAYRLVSFESIDSTNEAAKRLAGEGAAGGTVVWARQQTAGKARRGRGWVSEPGNLYCSVLLRPNRPAAEAMQMSFVAATAVADTVADAVAGPLVECKWPNDVLIDGRKVAGILLESSARNGLVPDWLVVGVGVNVAHHPPDAEFPATSLKAAGCGELDVAEMLSSFCRHFEGWYDAWSTRGFHPVREAWLRRARGIGAPLTVRLEGETIAGTFTGVDAQGALIVEAAEGTRCITSGDVFFAA